ncbi:MAG: cob(I)yrinic acid a,c-diamide adenosyltransferase [Clostridiaceae bacterium]|nr:cob(I)yrinic acid a,c-diamide adenosyltransferase [Clostridiaceae bacterium]
MAQHFMHVYCGDGKGKTTAAAGLSVRAAGRGKKVLFVQFMKGRQSGELFSFQELQGITVLRGAEQFPFYHKMNERQKEQMTQIHNGLLAQIEQALDAGECDLLVLDEVTYPYKWRLLDCERLCSLLVRARECAEIVCTGRDPADLFLEQADYITQMKCIRHPYQKGITAREGIEY